MGLYLLNATLIWGFGLLAYETLFRNETVHHWNRAYLLLTLLMGLFLPLWLWQPTATASAQVVYIVKPVMQLAAAKAAVAEVATPERTPFVVSWWMIYALGAAVSAAIMVRNLGRIAFLYRSGTRTRQAGWTLIETGRQHSPFSFFRWVFMPVDAPAATQDRLLILCHEHRHGSLLHSMDMILLQLMQIVFWFHPFIYWYRRRLELVHEYQADAAAGADIQTYGKLLLAQATGKPLPSLVHSFHRSSLKNRIAMLVKHPSGAARLIRYALTVPLAVGCALFCSRVAVAQSKKTIKGDKMIVDGNEFKMSRAVTDTVRMSDSGIAVTENIVVTLEPSPVELNGEKIYRIGDQGFTQGPRYAGPEKSATLQLFKAVQPALSRLPDGIYCIPMSSPVISKKGEIVYRDIEDVGIMYPGTEMGPRFQVVMDTLKKFRKPIDPELKAEIDDVIQAELQKPYRFKPGFLNGKPVISYLEDGDFDLCMRQRVEVRNGVARLVPVRR